MPCCGWVIARRGWRSERSLRTVALSISAAIVAHAVRVVHVWTHSGDYQDLLQASLSQGLTSLVGFLCLIAAGFGFVLAVFERVARQMEQLANHDGLTGHPTRSATDAMQALELLRGRRAGHAVACVLLDRDHFKAVNDRHGQIAEAMLTPGPDGPAVRVTVSAGLAVADPEPAVSADRLYGQADQVLYEAKRSGRNRVEAYGASAGASGLLPGLGAQ